MSQLKPFVVRYRLRGEVTVDHVSHEVFAIYSAVVPATSAAHAKRLVRQMHETAERITAQEGVS